MTKYLYICCDAGLANRMHAITGAHRLAAMLGRELRIYWPITQCCGARFRHLFVPGTISEDQFVQPAEIRDTLLATKTRVKWYCCGLESEGTRTMDAEQLRADDKEQVVAVKAWYIPKLFTESYAAPKQYIREHMATLFMPRPEIYTGRPRISRQIGMHIRYGDLLPSGEWDANTVHTFGISTADKFVEAARRCRHALPTASIHVASPNAEIEKMFVDRLDCPEHPVTRNEKALHNMWTVGGMREAVKDLWTLASSDLVLGSHASQYSQVAGELFNRPMVEIGTRECTERLNAELEKLKTV
jgi:hypothetical protein